MVAKKTAEQSASGRSRGTIPDAAGGAARKTTRAAARASGTVAKEAVAMKDRVTPKQTAKAGPATGRGRRGPTARTNAAKPAAAVPSRSRPAET
ncbi:hypothetical protein ACFUVU_31175, partial [Streptomyces griseoincarnatus]